MGFLKKIFSVRRSHSTSSNENTYRNDFYEEDDTAVRHDSSPPFAASLKEENSRKADVPEEKRAHSVVELQRTNESESWGLVLRGVGGIHPKIAHLHPGSLAQRSDMLSPGDVVTSVNGLSTRGMRADDATNLIESAKYKVVLDVEYEIPPARVSRPTFVKYKVWTVDNHHDEPSQTPDNVNTFPVAVA